MFNNTNFFPLNPNKNFNINPINNNPNKKNFLFTTKIHLNFTYKTNQIFTFHNNNNLWIFVNNQITLNLKNIHKPKQNTIDFDTITNLLKITPNNIYTMDIFHTKQHTSNSNFHFKTNISCFTPIDIPK